MNHFKSLLAILMIIAKFSSALTMSRYKGETGSRLTRLRREAGYETGANHKKREEERVEEEETVYNVPLSRNQFFQAAKLGKLDKIKEVVQQDRVHFYDLDEQGCTVLHWAIFYGHSDLVRYLLSKEFNESRSNKYTLHMLQKNIPGPVKLATMLGDHFKRKCDKRTHTAMFSSEGNRILTANCWGTIVWDYHGKRIDTQCPFSGMNSTSINDEDLEQLTLNSAVLSPDGNHILVANDKNVELRNMQGTRLAMLQHPEVSAEQALFGPLGNIILTVGKPQKVKDENHIDVTTNIAHLWDLSGNMLTGRGRGLRGDHYHLEEVYMPTSFSPDGSHIITGSSLMRSSLIQYYDLIILNRHPVIRAHVWKIFPRPVRDTKEHKITSIDHVGGVITTTFSPDGKYILTGGVDGLIKLSDLSGNILATINHGYLERPEFSAQFNATGTRILTAGSNQVQLWDLQGKELISIDHKGCSGATFSPDDTIIISYGTNFNFSDIHLWDLQGTKLARINHMDHFKSDSNSWYKCRARFSPSGNRILSSCIAYGYEDNRDHYFLWMLGGTPLDWALERAICSGDLHIVKIILESCKRWPDFVLINYCSKTSLHSIIHAASEVAKHDKKYYETLCTLVHLVCTHLKSLIVEKDSLGRTPLELATFYHLEEMKSLLTDQVKVAGESDAQSHGNIQSPPSEPQQSQPIISAPQLVTNESTKLSGTTLEAIANYLAVVAQNNPDQIEDELKQKGLEIHLPYYDSILYWATEKGHTELIEVLIHTLKAKGIDIDTNMEGSVPLLYGAVKNNHPAMVNILLKNGARPNNTPQHALPYLCIAARNNNIPILRNLLDYGAQVNIEDDTSQTALFYCDTIETAVFLIANDADINVQDNEGNSPLHHAIKKWLRAIAVHLVAKGADINAVNNNNESPFFEAACCGNIEALTLLFSEGANMDIKNKDGLTAQEWALENDRQGVIEWFKTHSKPVATVDEPKNQQETECCICFEPIEERYVSVPCGHTQTCYACGVQLKQCALCKSNIEKWIKLF